jgi:hypothetical protein
MTELVVAPWNLTGSGLILAYRFPRSFVLENGFVPPELQDSFVGGIGTVMLVDYRTSDVGPYRELLFIPGQFQIEGKRRYVITKIYVSTMASIVNGRANWAIPKELADFDVDDEAKSFSVSQNDQPFFSLTVQARSWNLPFNTAWLPIKVTLGQIQDEKLYITAPGGKGTVQFASAENIHVDSNLFPDIGQFRPLAAFRTQDFAITFPTADVTTFRSGMRVANEHP